ncbi:bifunctional 2-polyprenyl-6-hydroxyphenol methylase/3-demethylubiquinol 3-O-methyltransferase UbiG [uncultured Chryseobacterium sp.]|mgnify:CR=1 FL=1|uniref:class I SAM-dependent methyltransferase n=1 Tax=uncultured Chryseobacterium sp. TaxID=259322 RepID=UPI0026125CE2|nr:class I SAM-dependent methyltransferase [uncultured Chryseobacterium sp.]
MENYLEINRNSWNAKVEPHLKSDFYFVDEFLNGRTSLNSIELNLLGDVFGKEILHLQCHFGQDSISLARMGAKVTGIDLSDKAIEAAKELNEKCGTDAEFLVSDVYELPKNLNQKFDIVYTSYGTIGWLPDLKKWAEVIQHFLKPGGKFVFVEFHPVVWMFDDDFTHLKYNYFNEKPIVETYEGTYADFSAPLSQKYVMWNHPTSEVLNSLIQNKMEILSFDEFDWSPYPCFQHVEKFEEGQWRIPQFGNKVPHVFAITAQKKTDS